MRDRRGPIYNQTEERLYFTNAFENEICICDFKNKRSFVRTLSFDVAAFAFDQKNRLIVSHENGVHYLNGDASLSPIYDTERHTIKYANDMKVGPDGAIYVGTQSEKRKGVSNQIDGKLYRIFPTGEVSILLDGLSLSNGMEWSIDETKFYHTDSDTNLIREYDFDKSAGTIAFTGKELYVKGVDGFTIGQDGNLYVACWGKGHLAVVNTDSMQITDHISVPCKIPVSCSFCGPNMDVLAITTASYGMARSEDTNDGFTLLCRMDTVGRSPYRFGKTSKEIV